MKSQLSKKKIKVFLITLKKEKLRSQFMFAQLKKLKLDYEIFYATKGEKLSKVVLKKYNEKITFKNINRCMSLDEISCCVSHIEIYKKVIKQRIPYALILEDDVILKKDLIGALNSIKNFPKNWKLINFCSDTKQKKIIKFFNKYYLTYFVNGHNRTGAYLINYNSAKTLLKNAFPITRPPDLLTKDTFKWNESDLQEAYGVKPNLVKLSNHRSTIQYRNTIFGKTRWLSWIIKYNLIKYISR
jgi:glycosyl transferase family 25